MLNMNFWLVFSLFSFGAWHIDAALKIGAISYWDEPADFQRLPTSGLAILNPSDGMLTATSEDVQSFGDIFRNIKARSGVTVFGYVSTGTNTKRSNQAIEGDVRAYFGNFTLIDGIFFDELGPDCQTARATMGQYRQIVNRYKANAKIAWNPGYPGEDSCYLSAANQGEIVMDFESPFDVYKSQETQSEQEDANAKAKARGVLTWHAIYAVPTVNDMKSVVARAKGFGADYIYVSNLNLPNPYAPPPSYWQEEINYVNRHH